MSPKQQTPAPDPAVVTWLATSDLYPPLPGEPASMPHPSYRTGQRVPWPEIERHGWHGLVRDADDDSYQEPPDPSAAARTVHPVIAAHTEAQAPDVRVAGGAYGVPQRTPETPPDADAGAGSQAAPGDTTTPKEA